MQRFRRRGENPSRDHGGTGKGLQESERKGSVPPADLRLSLIFFAEDGEDDWGLSNPNHMALSEEDCDSESDEPRE